MKTKITKVTWLFMLAFGCLTAFAQTDAEKNKRQKQDEAGAALKKWFNEGEIIIEGKVDNFAGNEAGLCTKFKINHVLKGNINAGYLILQTPGRVVCGNCDNSFNVKHVDPDYPVGYNGVMTNGIYLVSIKRTDLTKECFNTENKGVYKQLGEAKYLTPENINNYHLLLKNYCGVHFKEPSQSEQEKNLKDWFTKGSVIVEGKVEDYTQLWLADGERVLCNKVLITRVLKGKINAGYVNIKTPGSIYQPKIETIPISERIAPDYPMWYKGIYYAPDKTFIFRIEPTNDVPKECFKTDNHGVFNVVDNDAIEIKNNDVTAYKMLNKCCETNIDLNVSELEKKSPISTENDKKDILTKYLQAIQPRIEHAKAAKTQATACSELFISEYLDGLVNNKAIEIFNPDNISKSLTGYFLRIYPLGSLIPVSIPLQGTIPSKGTFVIANPLAGSAILSKADQVDVALAFNGRNAVALTKTNTVIDRIGEPGILPSILGWTVPPNGSTMNHDLRRQYAITIGDSSWVNVQNQWNVFAEDSTGNLKIHQNTCSSTQSTNLTLTLANPVINGSNFEFDVLASSSPTTWFDYTAMHIHYDTLVFGSNIYANNHVTITQYSNFPSSTYLIYPADLSADSLTLGFGTDFNGTTFNRYHLTSSSTPMLHFKINIAHCGNVADIQFGDTDGLQLLSTYTNGQNDSPFNSVSYDLVSYNGNLQTLIPSCGTQITGFTPASVIAGAYYGINPGGESFLTINGSGFGNQKGTVYMTNAANHSPVYIPLDNFDINSWSATQITLLVPSVLFTSFAYPGTGYMYVKPNGASDSAMSSSMVQIPYALKNISFSSGGTGVSKERVPFAYRQLKDSTGHIDSAVYSFRFDQATITNNTNPRCRPLLKQAIKDWECGIPIRYRIGKDTTINNPNPDGISYITFGSTLSSPDFSAETGISVNQCSNGYSYATEADITFFTGVNWYYTNPSGVPLGSGTPSLPGSSQVDFFTTALHELGHASLLQHVNQTADLMYYFEPSSGTGPYISSDDQNGVVDNKNWSKTMSFGSCPYNPITIPSSGVTYCYDPANGIAEVGNTVFEILAYPNPANGFINVTFTKEKLSSNTIKLVNIIGQTVFYSNIGKNEGANEVINTSNLAKGVYLLIVTDNENTVSKKIIIE